MKQIGDFLVTPQQEELQQMDVAVIIDLRENEWASATSLIKLCLMPTLEWRSVHTKMLTYMHFSSWLHKQPH